MKKIDARGMDFTELNELIRNCSEDMVISNCLGQRFIGAGRSGRRITIESGVPGNALGAYLNGADIEVFGNAQDAVGDTMNSGEIIVHGSIGDTAGYAMRGGCIYVKGSAGYRTGIHMKEYREHRPVIVIGGRAGSFLGEYQAGGIIVVLGLNTDGKPIVSNFPCTGMHGGKLFLRSSCSNILFPSQVSARPAEGPDMDKINEYIIKYCSFFGEDPERILSSEFTVVTPNSADPYKQLYVAN